MSDQMSFTIDTLADAKQVVLNGRNEGVECPCCNQTAKVWRRAIVSTAAADLCALVSLYEGSHIHISRFTTQRSNFYMLSHWGLIGSAAQDVEGKQHGSGMWRPTSRGVAFVGRRANIRKYVLTYNNKAIGFDGPEVGIEEVLGSKFNYEELIKMNYGERMAG